MNDFETEFIGTMYIPEEDRDATLFLIKYADYSLLLSETERGLQELFRAVHIQMQNWSESRKEQNYFV